MQNLRVTLIQSDLQWEDKATNLNRFSEKINSVSGRTHLIILPETFTTGFSMNPTLAEKMDGPTMQWLTQQAASANAVVTGSFIAEEHGNYFNRLIWMQPDGEFFIYDKKHLFTLGKEGEYFTPGKNRLIVNLNGWKICPLICYDLRFPVWSRNTEDYDLLIYIASWPAPRAVHWKSLLVARAIENQVYTIGVNRIGNDGNNLSYTGDSSLMDFSGKTIYGIAETEDIFTATLEFEKQQEYRRRLNFLADRDDFRISKPTIKAG